MRIAINGCSGSGKSRLATLISERLGLAYTEIDSLYHGAGWVPRASFVADVEEIVAGERWVVEYQYSAVRSQILERAELVVWLDLPRWLTMWQVTRRTLARRIGRHELWNGNTEGPLWRILVDDGQIIRWAWSSHPRAALRIAEVQESRPTLPVVRLRSRAEVARWLDGLSEGSGTPAPPR